MFNHQENDMGEASPRSHRLSRIYFYLSGSCNLRCRHCWIAPQFASEAPSGPWLPMDLFRSILDQALPLGLSSVKLTGGEPLLHPRIAEVLDLLKARPIPVTIETNGTLCSFDLAERIAACTGVCVSVSLDGADAPTHEWVRGVPGCFDAALRGVRNLVDCGVRPQIIMTLMRRNRDQLEAMVRLAEDLGAGSVKFNLLQPTARGQALHASGESLTLEEILELGRWVENSLSSSTVLPVVFHHPAAFRPLGRMFGEKADGCGMCGILGILGVLADGSYALCGIGESVPEMVFGHASEDRLEDVWAESPVLKEIREGLPRRLDGACRDCLMKNFCFGSCIAQNYYRAGSLWAPFWFCEEAAARGLFPVSRLRPH